MAELLNSIHLIGAVQVIEPAVNIGINSATVNDNVRRFIPSEKFGHLFAYNQRKILKIASAISNITAAVLSLVKGVVEWVLNALSKLAALIHVKFLGVIGGFFSLAASVIDSVRLITKLESFKGKIEFELNDARRYANHKKEQEIIKYQIATGAEMFSAFFSGGVAIVTIATFFGAITLNPVVLITLLAISFIAVIVAFILKTAFKTEEIEKKYFLDAETRQQIKIQDLYWSKRREAAKIGPVDRGQNIDSKDPRKSK